MAAQVIAQRRAAVAQQRARPVDALFVPGRTHPRQAINPRRAAEVHQKAFGLIVGCMAQHHMADARPPCPLSPGGNKPQPGAARLIHQIAGFRRALPAQRLVRDATRRAEGGDTGGLGRGFGAQAMIDGDRRDGRATFHGPAVHQMQQRHGIATARNGDADPGGCFGQKGIAGGLQQGCIAVARRRSGHWQARPASAEEAWVAAAEPGKRMPTSCRVTQASDTCCRSASD